MQPIVDKRYFKNTQRFSPGNVGSVGDTIASTRYKHSAPDLPLRYDPYTYGNNGTRLGANVQNGSIPSYISGGGPAFTYYGGFGGRRNFKTCHGYQWQDLRRPDTRMEPLMGSTGRYDWYNRVANVYNAKRTGENFLPLPNGFSGQGVPRGGAVPRVVDVILPPDDPGQEILQRNDQGYQDIIDVQREYTRNLRKSKKAHWTTKGDVGFEQ